MSRWSGTTTCLAAFIATALSGTAGAEPARSTVAVVRTASSDRLLREAGTRLRAELADAGFDVVEVDRAPGDSRAEVEDAASGPSTFATVAMNRAGAGALADVWISDHVTGKTVVRRLRVGATPNAAAVLAIRALELLRASLLEVAAKERSSGPAPAAPSDVLRWVEPSLPERDPEAKDLMRGGAVGVGLLALHGLRGVGPALGPTLRLSHGIAGRCFGRLTLAGPLAGPEVHAPAGSASVRQELAAVDIGWAAEQRPLGALAWVGIGAFDLHVAGSAVAPYRSTSDTVLSFLATAGVGGIGRLGQRTALTAELSALWLVPRPRVVIGGRDAGSAGAPSLGLSLGLLVSL